MKWSIVKHHLEVLLVRELKLEEAITEISTKGPGRSFLVIGKERNKRPCFLNIRISQSADKGELMAVKKF